MSKIDEILANSTCALCGDSVHMNDEGRIACDGCNVATEECTCAGERPGKMTAL
jgi:uncharacterized membrane protein